MFTSHYLFTGKPKGSMTHWLHIVFTAKPDTYHDSKASENFESKQYPLGQRKLNPTQGLFMLDAEDGYADR